jgi:hypothetical protein
LTKDDFINHSVHVSESHPGQIIISATRPAVVYNWGAFDFPLNEEFEMGFAYHPLEGDASIKHLVAG